MKRANQQDIDLGLAVLSAIAKPGQRFSQGQIGKACGVTRGAVYFMERRAMKKVRERLRQQLHLSSGEFYAPEAKEAKL